MTIASFDIGEKNFAYCIGTQNEIYKWCHHDVMKTKLQTLLESCVAIADILEQEDWLECEHIIIEHQMRANYRAQRISQHVWTWFHCKYPHIPVTFVKASLKTQHFLGENTLSAQGRKKWAIEKARAILTTRNDTKHLDLLAAHKKQDDLADTLLQLLAYLKVKV